MQGLQGKSKDKKNTRHMGTHLDILEEIASQNTFILKLQDVAEWLNGV